MTLGTKKKKDEEEQRTCNELQEEQKIKQKCLRTKRT